MKRYLMVVAASLLLAVSTADAQDNNTSPDKKGKEKKTKQLGDKDKLKEYDEIIIKRKDQDKDTKVVIEIKDDEVFIDGKPIEEFENEDLSVLKRSMKRYKLNGPSSPFRFEGGDWKMDSDMLAGEERAFFGVMTEGSTNGAKVEKVTENSAASKAGIKTGDVITRINDKEVFDHESLSAVIGEMKPGDEITVTYKRDGKENKTKAKLEKRMMPVIAHNFREMNIPPIPPMEFDFDHDGNFNFDHDGQPGIKMREKPRLGIKAQDTEEGDGVKVLEVENGSAAEKAGIRQNDIITAFEGKPVKSASELARASREAREKSTLKVDLKRNGKQQSIEVKVPKKLKTANL